MQERSWFSGVAFGFVLGFLTLGFLSSVIVGGAGVATATADEEGERVRVVHDTRAVHKIDEEGLVRAVLLARGQNAYLGKLILQPRAQVAPRRTATEEYLYIIEGSSVLTVNGQSYIIGPNMAVYIPADGEVSFIVGSEPLVAVQVFAGPEPAARYNEWKTFDSSTVHHPRRKRKPKVKQSMLLDVDGVLEVDVLGEGMVQSVLDLRGE